MEKHQKHHKTTPQKQPHKPPKTLTTTHQNQHTQKQWSIIRLSRVLDRDRGSLSAV